MPLFRRTPPPAPPLDPDQWRPQRFGKGGGRTRDSIIEPSWGGVRVLARYDGSATKLIDDEGVDCTAEFAGVAAAITASALAGELILDGFLTVEPTQLGDASPISQDQTPTTGQMMTQFLVGSHVAARMAATPERQVDPDRPIAFVAVDMLSIDGSPLLDVPLLERKRLLDGALAPAELVRITPFVRPPIGSFVATWRGAGFGALAYKAPNSRYVPDSRNDDWSIMPMPPK
jgi:bifunctional non-homologous end joining protein LigD